MAARKKSRAAAARGAKKRPAAKPKRAASKSRRPAGGSRAKSAGKKAVKKKAVRRRAARPRAVSRRRAQAPPAAAAPVAPPNAIGLQVQHMDYTTHALDEVRRFYTEQLGFSNFTFDPTMSYLAVTTGPSSSIGFMPPMPVPPEKWQPPREPSIYLIVADVDRAHRELVARGVTFEQAPATMPWGHRMAVVRDPEGRMVCLAQILETS